MHCNLQHRGQGCIFLRRYRFTALSTKYSAADVKRGPTSNYIKYNLAMCQLFPFTAINNWKMSCSSSVQMDHNSIYDHYILDNICYILPRSTGWTRFNLFVKVINSSTWPRVNTKCTININLGLSVCVSNTNYYLSYVRTGKIQFPELSWSKIGTSKKQRKSSVDIVEAIFSCTKS